MPVGIKTRKLRAYRKRGKKYHMSRVAYKTKPRYRGIRLTGGYTGNKSGAMHWKGTPFPEVMYTEFTYGENLSINVVAGAVKNYYFCANGLYDPDITGITAPQPRYLDTLLGSNNSNAPYNSYVVYASKCTIQYIPIGTDSLSMRALVGLGCFNSIVTGPSSLSEMNIRADYKKKYMGYWYADNSAPTISRYEHIAPILGASKLDDKTGAQANYNANPSNQAYWGVSIVPIDETSSYTYRILVKIKYYVKLYARNDVSDS